MNRDEFSRGDVDVLSKRAGGRCSNPDCRRPTSGPKIVSGAANTGVAAHISAAAPGGPRYDVNLTADQRSSIDNGIWLCQICSRVIDTDLDRYNSATLRDWKSFAESAAHVEQHGFRISRSRSFNDLESKVSDLLSEMRADLRGNEFVREFIVMSKRHTYMGGEKPIFRYYHEDHSDLVNKMKVCENYGAIKNITYNSVDRYEFTEDFADYLTLGN